MCMIRTHLNGLRGELYWVRAVLGPCLEAESTPGTIQHEIEEHPVQIVTGECFGETASVHRFQVLLRNAAEGTSTHLEKQG